jgi:dipeptidyl aminopeptidase/acylaminoacyl peptidase
MRFGSEMPGTVSRRTGLELAAALAVGGLIGGARAQSAPPGLRQARFRTRGENRTILLVEPSTEGQASGAAVMLLHGAGGLRSDIPTFYPHALDWAARGYTVAMPNYFTETGDPRTEDTRWWAQSVADATSWTAALPGVDPQRIGAMGYSRGGYLAAEVAVQTTDIRAVVGVCSAGNVEPEDIVRRPTVLLIRADRDEVIPDHRTLRWARILEGRGVSVETVVMRGESHQLTSTAWSTVFERAEAFFARTIQTTESAPRS